MSSGTGGGRKKSNQVSPEPPQSHLIEPSKRPAAASQIPGTKKTINSGPTGGNQRKVAPIPQAVPHQPQQQEQPGQTTSITTTTNIAIPSDSKSETLKQQQQIKKQQNASETTGGGVIGVKGAQIKAAGTTEKGQQPTNSMKRDEAKTRIAAGNKERVAGGIRAKPAADSILIVQKRPQGDADASNKKGNSEAAAADGKAQGEDEQEGEESLQKDRFAYSSSSTELLDSNDNKKDNNNSDNNKNNEMQQQQQPASFITQVSQDDNSHSLGAGGRRPSMKFEKYKKRLEKHKSATTLASENTGGSSMNVDASSDSIHATSEMKRRGSAAVPPNLPVTSETGEEQEEQTGGTSTTGSNSPDPSQRGTEKSLLPISNVTPPPATTSGPTAGGQPSAGGTSNQTQQQLQQQQQHSSILSSLFQRIFCCSGPRSGTRKPPQTEKTVPTTPVQPKILSSKIESDASGANHDKQQQSPQSLTATAFINNNTGGAVGFHQVQTKSATQKFLLRPLAPEDYGKKCLVLDLDETLIHSSFKPIQQPDYIIPVEIDGVVHNVYVLKRPYVDEFLRRLGTLFEIVIFTASLAKYADPVIDNLDKTRVVKHRLFREACFNHRGSYVKDLSQLGRDLRGVIILDNAPASYLFHPSNAIPITTWFNDPNDTELLDLIPFLEDIRIVPDVRGILDGELDDEDDD